MITMNYLYAASMWNSDIIQKVIRLSCSIWNIFRFSDNTCSGYLFKHVKRTSRDMSNIHL